MHFRTDIPGWLHSNEVPALQQICKSMAQKKSIIQAGVFAGRTTQIFAQMCPSSDIYCIDPWPAFTPESMGGMTDYSGPKFDPETIQGIFKREISSKFPRVEAVQGFFPDDIPPEAKENLGLIHWDCDCVHDRALMISHFHAAWHLLPVGGILSGHTFAFWMPSVVDAVRHFGMEVNESIVLPPSASMWCMTKRR